jgi:hypothetical protein
MIEGKRGVAKPGIASALGAEDRWFESSRPDHPTLLPVPPRWFFFVYFRDFRAFVAAFDFGVFVAAFAFHPSGRRVVNETIIVNDKMQKGYRYLRTEPAGKRFAPEFKPELTPEQMLRLGIFGGKYMTDCRKEFPARWFAKAKLCAARHDARLNFFGVNASQPLAVWRRNGWIRPQDPRGWFQWYCRYFMGRRGPDDARQIRRWRAIARHAAAVRKNCEPRDLACRRRQRQALLHWAYDSRRI